MTLSEINQIYHSRGQQRLADDDLDNEMEIFDYLMYADLDFKHPEVIQNLMIGQIGLSKRPAFMALD